MSPRSSTRRVGALAALAVTSAALLAACTSTPASTPPPGQPGAALCPLTGTPAPGGKVPQRPAIAMKVDNYSYGPLPISPPYARPQSGLNVADVIFEEQVEGSITRYAAVFQCRGASLVGDIRSARLLDIGLLSELNHPLLVHVGGIAPVIANIDRSTLVDADLGTHPSTEINPAGRYPPYDDFTTTKKIWATYSTDRAVPMPIFTYSRRPIGGRPVSQVHLDWSTTSNIYWRWDRSTGTWLRFYDNSLTSTPVIQPDLLQSGVQNQAQNVVVQVAHLSFGSWLENFQGGHEVLAKLANSSGKAYVFRNGRMIVGTWSKGSLTSPTIFYDSAHRVIPLAPGRTWVELYPDTAPVQVTYPAAG